MPRWGGVGQPVLALAADVIYAIWSVRVTRVLDPRSSARVCCATMPRSPGAIERHDAKRRSA